MSETVSSENPTQLQLSPEELAAIVRSDDYKAKIDAIITDPDGYFATAREIAMPRAIRETERRLRQKRA